MFDYKKPLYESAKAAMGEMDLSSYLRIAEYFRLLGGYEDSPVLMEECISFPVTFYMRLRDQITAAKSTYELSCRIKEMEAILQTIGSEASGSAEWQNRNLDFQEAVRKRRKTVFLIEHSQAAAVSGIVCLFLLLSLGRAIYTIMMPKYLVFCAERAMSGGDYGKAVQSYEEAIKGNSDYRKDEEIQGNLKEARTKLGIQEMESQDYEAAAEHFKEAENEELFAKASLESALSLIESGDYGKALRYLEDAGNTKDADEARISFSGRLAGQEKYTEAIKALWQLEDQTACKDTLQELYKKRAEAHIQEALQLSEKDDDAVRRIGREIDDVDGLLYFIREMEKAGYDPFRLYPGGVIVNNLSLPCDFQESRENASPDLDKMLAVYVYPDVELYTTPGSMLYIHGGKGALSDTETRIRLFPQVLYAMEKHHRAESLEECTAFLLLRTTYEETGPVDGVWHSTLPQTGKVKDLSGKFQTYARRDEVYFCDKNHPEEIRLLASTLHQAKALEASRAEEADSGNPVYEYTDKDILHPASELLGEGDNVWAAQVLGEAVDLINGQGE